MKTGNVTGTGNQAILDKVIVPQPTIASAVNVADSLLGAIAADAIVVIDSGRNKVYGWTHTAPLAEEIFNYFDGNADSMFRLVPTESEKASTVWDLRKMQVHGGQSVLPSLTNAAGVVGDLAEIASYLRPAAGRKSAQQMVASFIDAVHSAGLETIVLLNQKNPEILVFLYADTSSAPELIGQGDIVAETVITVNITAEETPDNSWFAR